MSVRDPQDVILEALRKRGYVVSTATAKAVLGALEREYGRTIIVKRLPHPDPYVEAWYGGDEIDTIVVKVPIG